jgi:hypothetical protein
MKARGALFAVLALTGTLVATLTSAATRRYYIAAEDGIWDFAPSGKSLVHCYPDPAPCDIPAPWTDSHVFPVTRYIQYTDATFSTPVPQPVWLGILGPIIRAEVGDTVRGHFCNRARSGSYGMHPHGLRYAKRHEGAHYFGVEAGTPPGARGSHSPGRVLCLHLDCRCR